MRTLVFYRTSSNHEEHFHDPEWIILHDGVSVETFIESHQSRHVGCDLIFAIDITDEQAAALKLAIGLAEDSRAAQEAHRADPE